MGHLYLPVMTRPMPPGAVVENGVARWKTKAGKLRSAEAKGDRIVERSTRFVARYKDGEGVTRVVPTGCREESAARAVLVELERRAELVRAGVLTPAQDAVSTHKRTTITAHVDAYIQSLQARGCTPKHVHTQRRLLTTVLGECRFRALQDIKREPLEKWLLAGANKTRSARTRNTYIAAVKWFCNWAVDSDRLLASPIARMPQADEKLDRRRQPRALSAEEVERLIEAAQRRPLQEARKFNRGWRKSQPGARLRPETVAKLERLGLERALAWRTLTLTGLRLSELASIRVRDCVLDGPGPHLILDARNEKSRRGAHIPIRADLAADIRAWTMGMSPDDQLFRLNLGTVKTFNRDAKLAGIEKVDDRGRTACVHSLRHTHATLMSRAGVGSRIVQASMRHATSDMTNRVYVDPRLLDIERALDALPALPLSRTHSAAS